MAAKEQKHGEEPDSEKTLTPDDAVELYEELLSAQNHSYVLGLKFKLPPHVVQAIHSAKMPQDRCLLEVVLELTKQAHPTWRTIVDALRSPGVRLNALAEKLERAHLPDTVSTSQLMIFETSDTETDAGGVQSKMTTITTTGREKSAISDSKHKEDIPAGTTKSSVKVGREIRNIRARFNSIKMSTIQLLGRLKITVMTVAYLLTSIEALDYHKLFLQDNYKKIHSFKNHWELFGWLNFYWDCLTPDLLHQLLKELRQTDKSFSSILRDMVMYQRDLERFRMSTTLAMFCEAQPHRRIDPPPDFRVMVVEHDWPITITLEDVEMFRLELLQRYDLKRCALMVRCVRRGSFVVTWFVHISAVELLRKTTPDLYKEFSVTRVEIYSLSAIVVYQTSNLRTMHHSHTQGSLDVTINSRELVSMSMEELDDILVERPSEDFFCPVTMGLLLQPHLTSCCGNHLSQEAAYRIQGEGGVCPLCKEERWGTVLNKNFQRQSISLRVFCRYRERGCEWQGELAVFCSHIESCLLAGELLADEKVSEVTSCPPAAPPLPPPSLTTSQPWEVSMDWRKIKDIPTEKLSWANSVVIDGTVYCGGTDPLSDDVIRFNPKTDSWNILPKPPTKSFAMTSLHGQLVLIGGSAGGDRERSITTWDRSQRKWVNLYPPMPTSRSSSVALGYENYLIVACGFSYKNEVDVLDTSRYIWHSGEPLPIGGHSMTSAVVGDRWYLSSFGGWQDENEHIFCAHLPTLVSSATLRNSPVDTIIWNELPAPTVARPTLLSLQEHLLLVGGMGYSRQIHYYDTESELWIECGQLPVGVHAACCAILPCGELMVAGGFVENVGKNQHAWTAAINTDIIM